MKIVQAVDIALQNEPDLPFVDDEIDFESASDDTLMLLYQFMFPEENRHSAVDCATYDHDDDEINALVSSFSSDWFNTKSTGSIGLEIERLKLLSFPFNDDAIEIELPSSDGQRTKILIAREVWVKYFSVLPMVPMELFNIKTGKLHSDNTIEIELPSDDGQCKKILIAREVWQKFFSIEQRIFDKELIKKVAFEEAIGKIQSSDTFENDLPSQDDQHMQMLIDSESGDQNVDVSSSINEDNDSYYDGDGETEDSDEWNSPLSPNSLNANLFQLYHKKNM